MKLVDDKNNVQRSDAAQVEQEFQIASTPEAFKILFDGLYSDKIMATCREIICNAMDESPGRIPDITLPSVHHLNFVVRDYGTGLDHDDVMTMYTTVFRSTKKHANDKIGGFGLGSKAPFAYTDGFNVTSCYHEGGVTMRRVYSMFMDEDGRPRVTMMHEAETDESVGLEVSVPVRREDVNSFVGATQKVFRHFPEKRTPCLGGHSVPRPEYRGNWGSFAIAKYNAYLRTGSIVVLGNIQYPLELSTEFFDTAESEGYDPRMLKRVHGLGVTLFMDIGTVSLAPSREALSYTKATIKALCGALENVATTFQTELQAVVDSVSKSKWHRAKAFYGFLSNNQYHEELFQGYGFKGVFNTHKALYTGLRLPQPVEVLYPTTNRVDKLVIKKDTLRTLGVRSAGKGKLAFVILNGLTKESRVRTWARQQYNPDNEVTVVLFMSRAHAKTTLDLLDLPLTLLKLASELPVTVKPRAKRTSTNTNEGLRKFVDVYNNTNSSRYYRSAARRWESLADYQQEDFDFADGGYYVPVNRGQIVVTKTVNGVVTECNIHPDKVEAIQKVLKMGSVRVFGVRKAKHTKFAKADNWINLLDYAKKKAEAAITPEFLASRNTMTIGDPSTESLYNAMKSKGYQAIAATNPTLKKIWDQESTAKTSATKVRAVMALVDVAEVELPDLGALEGPKVTLEMLKRDFPMLKLLSGYWDVKKYSAEIIEYIMKMS